jgi:hypothetical protein
MEFVASRKKRRNLDSVLFSVGKTVAMVKRQTKRSLRPSIRSHLNKNSIITLKRHGILVLSCCLLITLLVSACVSLFYGWHLLRIDNDNNNNKLPPPEASLDFGRLKLPLNYSFSISDHILIDETTEPNRGCGLVLDSSLIQQWNKSNLPILTTAFDNNENPQQSMFLLTLTHLNEFYKDWYHAQWYCDQQPANVVGSEPPLANSPTQLLRHVLIVACPPNDGRAWMQLSVVQGVGPNSVSIIYDHLDGWWTCQTRHHPLTQHLKNTNYKVMSGTMVRGAESQALIPQWVEYHRLILGVEHFGIYINEPFQSFRSRSSFYDRPYITYVPFDFASPQAFFFQQVHQNDLIWRLKHKAQWVAMMDIDEYIFVPPPVAPSFYNLWHLLDATSFQEETQKSPAERFTQLLDKHESSTDVGGLALPNVFFGASEAIKDETDARDVESPPTLFICEYTWHGAIQPIRRTFQRQKILAIPDRVLYFSVHHITLGNNRTHTHNLDPFQEMRMHHFKEPSQGVIVSNNPSLITHVDATATRHLIRQSSDMKDACRLLRQELHKNL